MMLVNSWENNVNEFGVDYDDYDSQIKDSLYLHQNSVVTGLNKQLINYIMMK